MREIFFGAALIVTISSASMTYLFNNAAGSNNALAMASSIITASAFVLARLLRLV